MIGRTIGAALVSLALAAGAAAAGEADVVAAELHRMRGDTYRIDVTVRHADEGWQHYADKWDVLSPDGRVLGTRILLHPHETEQPFTRSLAGLRIPAGIEKVTVRAHDKVDGYGGKVVTVAVPR